MSSEEASKQIPETWRIFLEAFALTGTYGKDPMGILISHSKALIITFENVKRELIFGLLAMGYSDDWIIRNVPGGDVNNKYPLECVHADWDKEIAKIRQKREKTTVKKGPHGI